MAVNNIRSKKPPINENGTAITMSRSCPLVAARKVVWKTQIFQMIATAHQTERANQPNVRRYHGSGGKAFEVTAVCRPACGKMRKTVQMPSKVPATGIIELDNAKPPPPHI